MAIRTDIQKIKNGRLTSIIIDSITITGEVAFSITPPVLPYTLLAGEYVTVPVSYDNAGLSGGTHSAVITVVGDSGTYIATTTLSDVIGVQATPVLLNSLSLSTDIATPITASLSATDATSYAVTGLPAFASLNASTGEVTVTPDGTVYGQEKYDVTLSNIDGSTVVPDGLAISLFRNQATASSMKTYNPITPINVGSTITTTNASNLDLLIYDGPNNYWKQYQFYFSSYSIDNQLKILNLTTKLMESTTVGFWEGSALNGTRTLVHNDLNTYLRSGTSLGYVNANTGVLTTIDNLLPMDIIGGGMLYPSMELGIDGKIIFGAGSTIAGKTSIVEYDPTTETYVTFGPMNPEADDAGNRNACADATHLYESTNGNGSGYRVYAMDRATQTSVKIAICTNWTTAVQGKYGCWVYIPAGATKLDGTTPITEGVHWLWNGGLVFATNGLNQDTCPWDNLGEPFVVNTGAPIPVPYTDRTGLIPPAGETTGVFAWRDSLIDPYSTVDITGITKYPSPLSRILSAPIANKVISVASQYGGYSVYDIDTVSSSEYGIRDGAISNYCNLYHNGKVYFSGYPSGTLSEYNPTQPWDNTQLIYDPNATATPTANPKWIGFTRYDSPSIDGVSVGGTGGGQHKNFVLLGDGNFIWCFGEWERDGSGMGITSVDTANGYAMTGYRDVAWSSYVPRGGTQTDDYFVITCDTLGATPTSMGLFCMHKTTKAVHYIDLDALATLTYVTTIVGTTSIQSDTNSVCVATANSSKDLMLINIDIANSVVLYTKTFAGVYTNGGTFETLSDGNTYLGVDQGTLVVDTKTGLIDGVVNHGLLGGRTQGGDGKVYAVSTNDTYELPSSLLPSTFKLMPVGIDMSGTLREDALFLTMTDNLDGTYTFNDDGTSSAYYDIYFHMPYVPTGTINYTVKFNNVTGAVRFQTLQIGGSVIIVATDMVAEGLTVTGSITGATSTLVKLQMQASSVVSSFKLEELIVLDMG